MQVVLTLSVVQKVHLKSCYKSLITYLVFDLGGSAFGQDNDVTELAQDVAVVNHAEGLVSLDNLV